MRPWCGCGPAWTERDLHAPECNACEDAYDLGRDAALEEAVRHVEREIEAFPAGISVDEFLQWLSAGLRALASQPAERRYTLAEVEAAWARMLETPGMFNQPTPRWLELFRAALTGGGA